MTERIEKELALLRQHYANMEYREEGRWIRIPSYPLPAGWNRPATDVALQIPIAYPGGPPYGIYVPSGILFDGNQPRDYREPAAEKPPFDGDWGLFSWSTTDGQWRATSSANLAAGYTLLSWVKGFAVRFAEGA
jgi:hypothetical protein